jgi:hypothetical protein
LGGTATKSGTIAGSVGSGGAGGGAGPCTSGGAFITYVATGTRLGPLN